MTYSLDTVIRILFDGTQKEIMRLKKQSAADKNLQTLIKTITTLQTALISDAALSVSTKHLSADEEILLANYYDKTLSPEECTIVENKLTHDYTFLSAYIALRADMHSMSKKPAPLPKSIRHTNKPLKPVSLVLQNTLRGLVLLKTSIPNPILTLAPQVRTTEEKQTLRKISFLNNGWSISIEPSGRQTVRISLHNNTVSLPCTISLYADTILQEEAHITAVPFVFSAVPVHSKYEIRINNNVCCTIAFNEQ